MPGDNTPYRHVRARVHPRERRRLIEPILTPAGIHGVTYLDSDGWAFAIDGLGTTALETGLPDRAAARRAAYRAVEDLRAKGKDR